jgi:cyclohexyl-isocyanide hydratase
VREAGPDAGGAGDAYAPASLAREGFVHASYRNDVAESARLYFDPAAALEVLQIDPRRLDVPVEVAATPRGPMPHVHGRIPRDAVVAAHPVAAFAPAGTLPDEVRGTRFAFVAFEGMTLLDLVGIYDPISRIGSMGFDPSATFEIIGAHGGSVWTHDGAELLVTRVRPALTEFDVVVVPGGLGTRLLRHDASLVEWLASYPPNRLLASVCTGALLLGAAGRLQGKRATTHHSAEGEVAQYGATYVRERVVDEGAVVTAGGVTSGLELGLHLVRRLMGAEIAAKVALQMEVTWWHA